jgi:hypothetical protein
VIYYYKASDPIRDVMIMDKGDQSRTMMTTASMTTDAATRRTISATTTTTATTAITIKCSTLPIALE